MSVPIRIILDGSEVEVVSSVLTYTEIVSLSHPGQTLTFSVVYKNADQDKREGSLAPGGSVRVKSGTILNTAHTGSA